MRKIGVIGIGGIGEPLAKRLLDMGHSVGVCVHKNKSSSERLASIGAKVYPSVAALGAESDVIFTAVPDSPDVESVLFADGLVEALPKGATILDISTIDLIASRTLADRVHAAGRNFLDAPVSGGPKGAGSGTLSIMVGGRRSVFETHEVLLRQVGKNVVYCGENGLGLAAKLATNMVSSATIAALSEAISLAVKAGIKPEVLNEALQGGAADSYILKLKFPAYLKEDYAPGFRLAHMCKDIGIINNCAKKLGSPAFVSAVVEQVFNQAKGRHGDKDSGAVSLFYQELGGTSFKASN